LTQFAFFLIRNPEIARRQSRNYGIGEFGWDPGIPGLPTSPCQQILKYSLNCIAVRIQTLRIGRDKQRLLCFTVHVKKTSDVERLSSLIHRWAMPV